MEKIVLNFQGPFRWHGSLEEVVFSQEGIIDQPGIYLWCAEQPQGYLVYYVGETGVSFKYRFEGHAKSYYCGEYSFLNTDEFVQGKRVVVWWGKLRMKENWASEFNQKSQELIPKLVEFLGVMRIFLAPLNVERNIRQRIESTIAAHLKKQPEPIGSFIDADRRHSRELVNNEKILVEVNTPRPIQGISPIFEVQIPKTT
jgi:hypothetical protein